jgi:hypothetical protein
MYYIGLFQDGLDGLLKNIQGIQGGCKKDNGNQR